MEKINVIAVDDSKLHNSMLRSLFKNITEINFLGAVKTEPEMYLMLKNHPVDVILLDVEMPSKNGGKDGFQIARKIKTTSFKDVKIICVTVNTRSSWLRTFIKELGVDGYFDKMEIDGLELAQGIRKLMTQYPESIPVVSDNLKRKVKRIMNADDVTHEVESLTKRQMELLPYMARGYKNKEIADLLFQRNNDAVSPKTIYNHRNKIHEKLDCHNQAQLAEKYFSYIFLQTDDQNDLPNFKKAFKEKE